MNLSAHPLPSTLPLHPWHIDWLSMYQDHAGSAVLPVVSVGVEQGGEGVTVEPLPVICRHSFQRTDTETGAVDEFHSPRQFQGSFSTSIAVRCDGRRVEVSGNPSKFCRLDNLFGYRSIDDAVAVFNVVLAHLGLPSFTTATFYRPLQSRTEQHEFITDGAVFTRFDLTVNHAVGDPQQVRPFIRAISSQSIQGALGHLSPDGLTAMWFQGSRRRFDKFYAKAAEMRAHWPKFPVTDEQADYLRSLTDYVESVGCVREEHELKAMKLRDANCRIYGHFTETELNALFENSREMLTRVEVTTMNFDDVAERLLSKHIVDSPRTAARMQMLVHAWLNGQDMHKLLPGKSAFYDARRTLLPLGIDIKTPCDVTRLMPRIQPIQLRPMPVPDFYRPPSLADVRFSTQLKQVA